MEEGKVLHVVMFPWLGMGHFIPFFYLSKCLAQKGHHISFISTPRNLQRLPKIPSKLAPLIDLVSLPLPKVDNLSDHEEAESSMDIPHHKSQLLKKAFDLLKLPLANFLENTSPRPDWIVYDYASHWVPSIAVNLGISRAYLSLFSAATMAYLGPPWALPARSTAEDFAVVPKWVPFQTNVAYRLYEVLKITESSGENESGTSDEERFGVSVDGSDVMFIRTSVEFEPEWFNLVCELYQKPVVSVGVLPPLLVPPPPQDSGETEDDEKWVITKKWLDKQSADSVVYVALGTEATLNQSQLTELALGLEQSGIPFFLVVRRPPGSTHGELELELELVPDGFKERVKGRGFVYVGWAPQAKILGHSAIGSFLTHCGWNSIIEGLGFGRALILLPLINEQPLNARLVEGKKLGVEIPRNEQDGSFTRDSVAESVKLVMVSQEGESVRAKAREMRDLFGNNELNDRRVDGFVQYLTDARTSQ